MLLLVAGDTAPAGDLNGDPVDRRRCRDAWRTWWDRHGAGLDLARVEGLRPQLGHTLLAQLDANGGVNGRVLEMDRKGQTLWQIDGLRYPIDAHLIDPWRVLVTEYCDRTVSERNLQGRVLWAKRVAGLPLGAERLPDGNTFIVTRNQLLEVNRAGDEVWKLDVRHGVSAATHLSDGQVALITTAGEFQRLDRAGKPLQSFRVGLVASVGSHLQALPNGHVLVPLYSGNRVVEFDADGRAVWSAPARRPTCVHRLPNGHTLVASRMSNLVVELDRKGREVRAQRTEGRPLRVRRR
jgi:hypothetical protein